MISQPPQDPRIMEIYKLAVEMADKISARRAVANAFFLTVNTTLIAVAGLRVAVAGSMLLSIAVCVAGVAVAACWWFLLQNYRRLSEAKFKVISRIEDVHLPIKIFMDEWTALGGEFPPVGRTGKIRAHFMQLSGIERIIPIVFAILYLVIFIRSLVE